MINKLTEEQQKNIAKTRKKYLDIFYDPDNANIPHEVYVQQYSKLYEFIGEKKPKLVIVMDSPLGVQVAYNLRYNLVENLGYNLGDNLWANLWDNLQANLRDNLQANLRDNLQANLRYNLEANLRSNLRDNLWDNLGDNLRANLRDNLEGATQFSLWGESTDFFWVGHYMYAIENFEFIPSDLSLKLKDYESIITTAPSFLNCLCKEVAIVGRTPIKCYRDIDGRLHNDEGGMAVEFADGWGIYGINGVTFNDVELYKKIVNKTITAEEVAKIQNTEQRMIALKYLSPEQFLKGSKAKQIGKTTNKGNALYRGEFDEVGEIWFLRFQCPSTGRDYIEFTNPSMFEAELKKINGSDVDIYNPDVLQAYSFTFEDEGVKEHLSLSDYLAMEVET